MLMRRFTIVCLLTALFGIAFASIVAEATRSRAPWQLGAVVPCTLDQGVECGPRRQEWR